MTNETTANIRPLQPDDLERVVEIDTRITGRSRRNFFEKRLEAALADARGFVAVALDGASGLTGFAIARLQSGEYGNDRQTAVLDVIGVDPDAWNQGCGQALLEAVSELLKNKGISQLRTQVDWSNQGMSRFFAAAGFSLAPEHVLERAAARTL